eukprot:m.185693 g.185693  ORF g.185693 m.185693 type:complete len:449 (+) comp24742_c0_seq2:2001-3347(+)
MMPSSLLKALVALDMGSTAMPADAIPLKIWTKRYERSRSRRSVSSPSWTRTVSVLQSSGAASAVKPSSQMGGSPHAGHPSWGSLTASLPLKPWKVTLDPLGHCPSVWYARFHCVHWRSSSTFAVSNVECWSAKYGWHPTMNGAGLDSIRFTPRTCTVNPAASSVYVTVTSTTKGYPGSLPLNVTSSTTVALAAVAAVDTTRSGRPLIRNPCRTVSFVGLSCSVRPLNVYSPLATRLANGMRSAPSDGLPCMSSAVQFDCAAPHREAITSLTTNPRPSAVVGFRRATRSTFPPQFQSTSADSPVAVLVSTLLRTAACPAVVEWYTLSVIAKGDLSARAAAVRVRVGVGAALVSALVTSDEPRSRRAAIARGSSTVGAAATPSPTEHSIDKPATSMAIGCIAALRELSCCCPCHKRLHCARRSSQDRSRETLSQVIEWQRVCRLSAWDAP